ncbi:melanoma inhibitory activity protein 3-like [Sinocyclocheilus anshuiensis]|uniref:melanoma inhibitory activity protein 3-like n=1 Tax=Sinocyclocheilus anshuiensis TaxID=1608454 RepID=UPI0007BA577E|nr:PREDICTED: melanoma inhibitory activity protein 3-like [Sinocyclocheilus anshuiensis]
MAAPNPCFYCVFMLVLYACFPQSSADRRFSDLKRCADDECSMLLGRGKAAKDFTGPDCRFLSFKKGETIYVYYKLSGQRSDVWAGSVGNHFGYFPKEYLNINHIYTENELEVPTEGTDFVCFETGLDKFESYDIDVLLGSRVGNHFGYFPKEYLNINHIYTENELEVPTEETDFVCFETGLDKFESYDVDVLLGSTLLLENENSTEESKEPAQNEDASQMTTTESVEPLESESLDSESTSILESESLDSESTSILKSESLGSESKSLLESNSVDSESESLHESKSVDSESTLLLESKSEDSESLHESKSVDSESTPLLESKSEDSESLHESKSVDSESTPLLESKSEDSESLHESKSVDSESTLLL